MKSIFLSLLWAEALLSAVQLGRYSRIDPSEITGRSERNLKNIYYYNAFPNQISNPFNMYSNYNIFNPNQQHITDKSPMQQAFLGVHPYAANGITLPFVDPNMMMSPYIVGPNGGAMNLQQNIFSPMNQGLMDGAALESKKNELEAKDINKLETGEDGQEELID